MIKPVKLDNITTSDEHTSNFMDVAQALDITIDCELKELFHDKGITHGDYINCDVSREQAVDSMLETLDDLDCDGRVHELIHGMVDIYHSELFEWAKEHYHFVDRARQDGLASKCSTVVQQAQCIEQSDYIYKCIDTTRDNIKAAL